MSSTLEIWQVSTRVYAGSGNTLFSSMTPFTLLMSAFLCKKPVFLVKNSTLTQRSSIRSVIESFSSVFVRQKVIINENVSFADYDPVSDFKIAPNWP